MNARLRSLVLATVATVASLVCGGVAALAAPASASALAPAATVTTTATAPGTVSANLTIGSATIAGSKASDVTCKVIGSTYTVTTSRVTVNGHQVNGRVVIRNYAGPGTYTVAVSLTVTGPKANVTGLVKGVQVTVDEAGGTWSFTKTATGNQYPKLQGRTISGSLSYGCNA